MEGIIYLLQQFWSMVTPFGISDVIDIAIMSFIRRRVAGLRILAG